MKNVSGIVVATLLLGLIIQSVQLASHWSAPEGMPLPFEWTVGDTLAQLVGVGGDGQAAALDIRTDSQAVTVIYAFYSECVFCHDVAPAWSAHFRAPTGGIQRVAVTRDPPELAVPYAERFQWDVDIVSIPQVTLSDRVYALTVRTPWLFVFDRWGVLRLEGHGSQLDRIGEFAAGLMAETDG